MRARRTRASAENRRGEQVPVFERLGDVHSRAVTIGKIAGILQARGELDQALKIHREDELPVFERLGDVHSRAATLYKIVDVLLETNGIQRGRIQEIADTLGDVLHSMQIAQRDSGA